MFGNLKKYDKKSRNIIQLLKVQYYLCILSIVILIIGFSHYYYLKRIEYKHNWSFWTFILGNNVCKSIKHLKVV